MKKALNLLLLLVLLSSILIGCSSGNPTVSTKSEGELKAEVKAEMEAESY